VVTRLDKIKIKSDFEFFRVFAFSIERAKSVLKAKRTYFVIVLLMTNIREKE